MTTKALAIIVTNDASLRDPALQAGTRGARKLLVTEIFEHKEQLASDIVWAPPSENAKCSVQLMPDTEVAVFNQFANQDRHYHREGTEIYIVVQGTMVIEVAGQDHKLSAGDMIVVNPDTVHAVKPEGTEFLCRVVTVNCGGEKDKFLA